jgi:hypothetical protein
MTTKTKKSYDRIESSTKEEDIFDLQSNFLFIFLNYFNSSPTLPRNSQPTHQPALELTFIVAVGIYP